MGGTFDPIHLAHLEMARCALLQKKLDVVWFMPSKNPPHKEGKNVSSEELRSELIRLAIAEEPSFLYSDFELKREGTTYTAETLSLLKRTYPAEEFFFILGEDSLAQLDSWYHPEIILRHAVLLAVHRGAAPMQEIERRAREVSERYNGTVEVLSMQKMDISSSLIRKKLLCRETVQHLLPDKVYEYIRTHNCYQDLRTGCNVS